MVLEELGLVLLWIVVEDEEGERTKLAEQIRQYSFHCCHCRLLMENLIHHRVRQRKKDTQEQHLALLPCVFLFPQHGRTQNKD
jgi:hypothetical protein